MKHLTITLLTLLVLGGCSSLIDTQLAYASTSNYSKVEDLVTRGADINKPVNGSYPLYRALSENKTSIAKLLLKNGANPNLPDLNNGEHPLAWAVVNQSETQVRMLLENGANPNGTLNNKDSYLVHASLKNELGILKILLDAGADPNELNANGIGPLSVSVRHENYELTGLLLEYGARKDLDHFWNEVIYYNSSTYFITSSFLDLNLTGGPILIGNQNEKGVVGKGILINPRERFRYEGYLEESIANGEGKLITEDSVYEGFFDKGIFISGSKSIRDKTAENRVVSINNKTDDTPLINSNEVSEITKKVVVGTAVVTGKIFVGLMKFTGQVLLGVAKELPSAYAEQKRIEAISRKAYKRGMSDGRVQGRNQCRGSATC